jgi:prepilin-type N-terminal cleavage/methylation domain-containing protein
MGVSRWKRLQGEAGFTLAEIMVCIVILGTTLLSLTAASGYAARELSASRRDLTWWAVAQTQLESLAAEGFKDVASDSATVQGVPMTWTVAGTDPKTVTLVVRHVNSVGGTVRDTLLLILPSSDTLP